MRAFTFCRYCPPIVFCPQIWMTKMNSKIEGNTMGFLRRSFFPFNTPGMPSFNNSVLKGFFWAWLLHKKMHRRQASHLCQSWLFYIAFLRLKDSGKNKRYYCREGAKILQVHFKTIYSKYSTQWFYLLAVTMDSGFSKKIKPWIFFSFTFQVILVEIHFELNKIH